MEVKNNLVTQNYTKIEHEDDWKFNAPHHFQIKKVESEEVVTEIHMQEGAIKENGVNGCANEDLLAIVLQRLYSFQNTEYSCVENENAIKSIEESLKHLRSRTNRRVETGTVETSEGN